MEPRAALIFAAEASEFTVTVKAYSRSLRQEGKNQRQKGNLSTG
jgi:hypothetical protein